MTKAKIAVLGAGLMGHGIAQTFAAAGHEVAITDPDEVVLNSAPERIRAIFELLELDTANVQNVTLFPKVEDAVVGVDFVFEAAPEKLELKQSIFADLAEMTDDIRSA